MIFLLTVACAHVQTREVVVEVERPVYVRATCEQALHGRVIHLVTKDQQITVELDYGVCSNAESYLYRGDNGVYKTKVER